MRRAAIILLILVLSFLLPASVLATDKIEIIHQPQNMIFPEHASANWSVEATGDGLAYEWFIVYKGIAYNTAESFDENHPWQVGVVGDGYGRNDIGNAFFINGIGSALDGAEIYCVISNKTGSVTSQRAHISVGGQSLPPRLKVPAAVTIKKDKILKLLCDAEAFEGDDIKSYTWYETDTGALKDIVAIGAQDGQPEEYPILVCDTTMLGTRYYVCCVETNLGGKAYSSVIPVTVIEGSELPDNSPTASDTEGAPAYSQMPSTDGTADLGGNTGKPEEHNTVDASEGSEKSPQDNNDKAGVSPLVIALIAVGGAALGSGGVIVAAKVAKDKHPR